METRQHQDRPLRHVGRSGIRPGHMGLSLALCALVGGCAFLDEFSFRHLREDLAPDPDPLVVIRSSNDGNKRAKALRNLHEPQATGGSQQDQDVIVKILTHSATHEAQALCRMAAIDSLRTFKDPRAVEAIKDAYYRAGSFNPETATVIRCQAMAALGEMGNPSAIDLLVRVLREPPVEGPDQDRQLKMDERIAAARALGRFQQYQGTAALVDVLRNEEDIALRTRAHQSLVSATGQELPPDAKTWADFLHNPASKPAVARQPGVGEKILELTGFK